jgi:DMSO/TMAO reductase YedYZ molybdopterin-dependent catalytic subunit
MEKVKRFSKVIAVVLIAIMLAVLVFTIIYVQSIPKPLYAGEVQNYRGENLSRINNIVDNAIKGTQYLNTSTYRLTVTGLVNQTLSYTYDDILNAFQKYQKVVTLNCVEGWSAKILWEGFLVSDLIAEAGVNSNATAIIFHASDGYTTALPLDYITSHNIIVACKMNGVVIPAQKGFPFQLVAESQYGYKWIKWITSFELTDNSGYLGFWESRGYPNNATIP